jgi:tRNA modification GTPase
MTRDWRAALLTPPGMAAIAVIAIRGEQLFPSLTSCLKLRGNRSLADLQIGAVHVANFHHASNGATEEVVIASLEPDLLEIQCHGGRLAAQSILNTLKNLSATIVAPQDWATLEDHCPIRAAARLALSQAQTPHATRILLRQFRGALREEIEAIITLIRANDASQPLNRLQTLLDRRCIGLRLISGFQVALLGKPNVGKSSLLNALLGYSRAIVLDEPGTTRDVLTAKAAFGGWPITLTDLAGIRPSSDPIEVEGVRRARSSAANSDLVLLVSDGSLPWSAEESELLATFSRAIVVHNKSDLPGNEINRPKGVWLSATTGQGLTELERAMLEYLITPKPAPGDPVPFHQSQITAISIAIAFLQIGDPESASRILLQMLNPAAYATQSPFAPRKSTEKSFEE